MTENQERYDVIITGGGPVGLTLALSLTRFMGGMRIALVDRREVSVPKDARASALSAGVGRIYEALGLWPALRESAEPIKAMKISDSGRHDISRPFFLDFAGEVAPGEPFAHMVPNTVLAQNLLAALAGKVDFIAPVEVTGFSGEGRAALLTLKDGRVLSAPLIVAADGQNSALRTMARIGTIEHDYKQAGIVTTISHELDHAGVAYEHFRPAGPFASLPLSGRRSSLVWTETPEAAARYKAMGAKEVEAEIEAVMGSGLGAVRMESPIQVFPLKMKLARAFIGPRLALIGDAAHVVHPVAGQGLNLGLKDVAALAEVVIGAMRLGLDHGGSQVLERYQRWRRFDTSSMAMVTDTMNRLFSNDIAPLKATRDLGLKLVDTMPPVKSALIRHAAGVAGGPLAGHRPRLLAGAAI